jgi:hypothetical protein
MSPKVRRLNGFSVAWALDLLSLLRQIMNNLLDTDSRVSFLFFPRGEHPVAASFQGAAA